MQSQGHMFSTCQKSDATGKLVHSSLSNANSSHTQQASNSFLRSQLDSFNHIAKGLSRQNPRDRLDSRKLPCYIEAGSYDIDAHDSMILDESGVKAH